MQEGPDDGYDTTCSLSTLVLYGRLNSVCAVSLGSARQRLPAQMVLAVWDHRRMWHNVSAARVLVNRCVSVPSVGHGIVILEQVGE